jgi:hypothetical protein
MTAREGIDSNVTRYLKINPSSAAVFLKAYGIFPVLSALLPKWIRAF